MKTYCAYVEDGENISLYFHHIVADNIEDAFNRTKELLRFHNMAQAVIVNLTCNQQR